jgi:methionyl-tRNA formyltransferase
MFKQAAKDLPEVIEGFTTGALKPIEQDHQKATFCGHITRESGYFDIENPPTKDKLDRMIRAYYPWPSAWTRWNGKIVKFLPEGKMQMEGKNPVSKKEFLNGFKDFPEII